MNVHRFVLAAVLLCTGTAHANQPWWHYHDVVSERHERWSYTPLLSFHAGRASDDEVPLMLGAHLRWRYGVSKGGTSPRREEPIRLLTFGLGVETDRFASIEPSAAIGIQAMPTSCFCWGAPMWLGLRAELAAGYRFADEEAAPFASVKLAIGAVFSRRFDHVANGFSKQMVRFRSEVDLVAKAQLGLDGRWMIVGGIELDPTRLLQDLAEMFP